MPDLEDAAVVNSGVSRWHNYYVEGLNWLVKNVGIDGLYIDDMAFDRITMKRVRKVLDRGRDGALIDLHSANQFNARDGFASSANLYLEHFPYLNRLWFGEYFDYNPSPHDFWLVEISGIPFGLMGEMLQDGGNPWRGMVFGMTSRLGFFAPFLLLALPLSPTNDGIRYLLPAFPFAVCWIPQGFCGCGISPCARQEIAADPCPSAGPSGRLSDSSCAGRSQPCKTISL